MGDENILNNSEEKNNGQEQNFRSLVNNLWVEKYRPKKIEDLILSDDNRELFSKAIHDKQINNYLFVGPPGSGKSTLARILTSIHGVITKRDNVLAINGSSKASRGIDFVEQVIEPFLKVPPLGKDKHRIVFIDESDYLTDQSFHSQRAVIEKYNKFGRFILTANYLTKIPEAIQSRFQVFNFKQIPINFITEYCQNILEKENISFNQKDLKYIIEKLYPDVRKIINTLQKSITKNKLKLNKNITITSENEICSNFENICESFDKKQYSKINSYVDKILETLNKQDFDYRSVFSRLFNSEKVKASVKIIINKYSNSHQNCLIPSMHFMAMIFESIVCMKEYLS